MYCYHRKKPPAKRPINRLVPQHFHREQPAGPTAHHAKLMKGALTHAPAPPHRPALINGKNEECNTTHYNNSHYQY